MNAINTVVYIGFCCHGKIYCPTVRRVARPLRSKRAFPNNTVRQAIDQARFGFLFVESFHWFKVFCAVWIKRNEWKGKRVVPYTEKIFTRTRKRNLFYWCNFLIHSHFSVHIRGVHECKTRLCVFKGLCITSFEVCWRCQRLSSTSSTCFNIHRIWWYGWKALSLSFPKLFLDWKSIKY